MPPKYPVSGPAACEQTRTAANEMSTIDAVKSMIYRRLEELEGTGANWKELGLGCPPGIRTPIGCSRGSCPTIERGGNIGRASALRAACLESTAGQGSSIPTCSS